MDLGALVNQFGFPVAIAVYFIWRDYQSSKEHKKDLGDIAIKAVQAVDKSTEAINDSIECIGKSNTVISENSNILNSVKGVLLGRGNKNDRGNGS